ncbi:hypothetical protein [Streptomyces sp. SID10815]|uniref:hypothetical protein n=1 Tax=Streptomyces sp. SID10815 TaxID=2706027 RepID=UPI0013C85119|nr:hypothetical protein [Streptomyces sp. SID10815]NEA45378.1 hypothetical protein [Streptomyces sp. SID10815]
MLTRLHASTRRWEPLTADATTGEVRVPLSLYSVDQQQGDVDLVLSRSDAQRLFTQLAEGLGFVHPMPAQRSLGALR